jgi:hypothetical protein
MSGVIAASTAVSVGRPPSSVVAGITMPRRHIGRGELTEGEASELKHASRDIAATGRVEQVAVVAEVSRQGARILAARGEHIEREVALIR